MNKFIKWFGMFANVFPWRWAIAYGKAQARKIVREEGDSLQDEGVEFIKDRGPSGVDDAFDKSQARLIAAVNRIKLLPGFAKTIINDIVRDEGDRWQAKAKLAVLDQGVGAFNRVVDQAQDKLIARIDEL